ncbi:DUF4861 domain-containing protein [Marinoscillum furvescens]|uniref:Uncharacterized protein DUF4861 n=1 Tax=Marinoscillum furvescens DSM 4134 TaxID=1122208 RepID=A0A3D9KZJ3_MARFU|nr:DUF4861 domain-containing protein [Marinoscillum furvescens]RED93834.1 uncharacterized protein DUF4861 [Marinoscillum furvescens DSM 4134]
MKNSIIILSLAASVLACEQKNQLILESSESGIDAKSVVLSRTEVPAVSTEFFLLKDTQGQTLPLQFDDLDSDGKWDEVAFQVSFETNQVALEVFPAEEADLPDFPMRTDVYLGHSPERNGQFQSVSYNERPADHVAMSTPFLYQYEGPGWESDLVAFRTYFDSRNGKDIFGKTKPALQITKIGLEGNYHELADWGMDVLKVGNSLGAGAIAMLKNDSIYKLGDTDLASFEIVTEGPVRSILKLKYSGWDVAGETYDLEETISIWAGKRSYQSALKLKNASSDTLVTGIVNLKDLSAQDLEVSGFKIRYTHGKQSENKDELGMAVMVPVAGAAGFGAAPEQGDGVTNTYTAMLSPVEGTYTYHFYAGWVQENAAFKDEESFKASLTAAAKELNAEVSIVK